MKFMLNTCVHCAGHELWISIRHPWIKLPIKILQKRILFLKNIYMQNISFHISRKCETKIDWKIYIKCKVEMKIFVYYLFSAAVKQPDNIHKLKPKDCIIC